MSFLLLTFIGMILNALQIYQITGQNGFAFKFTNNTV
jgi:hypothetical protein